MGIFGGQNSIFNNPGQVWGGSNSVVNNPSQVAAGGVGLFGGGAGLLQNVWNFANNAFNQPGPALQPPPMPPNPSAVAGASLQQDLTQESQAFSASTLLNGASGIPLPQGVQASNVLHGGSR